MAGKKPSERFSTHKIGSSSDPTKPVGLDDYVIVESADTTKYPDEDDRVRVAKQRDIVEDYFGLAHSKNLFNLDTCVEGYYVNDSNGVLSSNADYVSSDWISVEAGTQYAFTSVIKKMAYYDSEKVYISGESSPESPFTTPANCAYIRICGSIKTYPGWLLEQQVEKGSVSTAYEGYYKKLSAEKLLDKAAVYNVTKEVPIAPSYYTSVTARAAVPLTERKLGMILTYETSAGVWVVEQFCGTVTTDTATTGWTGLKTDRNWKLLSYNSFGNPFTVIGAYIKVTFTGETPTGTTFNNNSSYSITDYIKIMRDSSTTPPNTIGYPLQDIMVMGFSGSSEALLAFYDSNKAFVSAIYGTDKKDKLITITKAEIPVNAVYVVACIKNTDGGMLVMDSLASINQKVLQTEASIASIATTFNNKSAMYNVTKEVPIAPSYYTSVTARTAVPAAVRKLGMILTYETSAGVWVVEQFCGTVTTATATTGWTGLKTDRNWKLLSYNMFGDPFIIGGSRIMNTGAAQAEANYSRTDYMKITRDPSGAAIQDIMVYGTSSDNVALVAFYDENKAYIAGSAICDINKANKLITITKAEVPATAAYLIASMHTATGGLLIMDSLISINKRISDVEASVASEIADIEAEVAAHPSFNDSESFFLNAEDGIDEAAVMAGYKQTLDSLLALQKSGEATEVALTIPGLGRDISKHVARVRLHYGADRGTKSSASDVYFNEGCAKDFSDVRFFDESGNMLDFYIHSTGNYDFVRDSRIPDMAFISTEGELVAGWKYSTNNAVSWTNIGGGGTIIHLKQRVSALNRIFLWSGVAGSRVLSYLDRDAETIYAGAPTEITVLVEQDDQPGIDTLGKWLNDPLCIASRVMMEEDDEGSLYLVKYTEYPPAAARCEVLRSVNDGVNWERVYYNTTNHHIHQMDIDRTDPDNNVLYVGLDGVGEIRPKNVCVAVDRSASASDLKALFVDVPDPTGKWAVEHPYHAGIDDSGNHYLIGYGETMIFGGPGLWKYQGGEFSPSLPIWERIRLVRTIEGDLYATVVASGYSNKTAMTLRSTDHGATWVAVDAENYADCTGMGTASAYYFSNHAQAAGDTEACTIMTGNGTASGNVYNEVTNPLRLYIGGNNYFALAYVKVGALPAAGIRTITARSNYAVRQPLQIPFYDDMQTDYLIFHAKMNEGRGVYVQDYVGRKYYKLPSDSVWVNEEAARYGHLWPRISRGKTYGLVVGDSPVKISDASLLPDKNFTVTFWYKKTASLGDDIFVFGNPDGVHIRLSGNTVKVVYGNNVISTYLGYAASFKNNLDWFFASITVSNHTRPVLKACENISPVSAAVTASADWTPPQNAPSTYFLNCGAPLRPKFPLPISDFRVYDKLLTLTEIRDIMYGNESQEITVNV